MKKTITLSALCLLTLGLFAQAEEALALETETGAIHGTLTLPAATGQVPVVLIIAGSGATDRDGNNPMMANNSLKMLAEGLQSNGIAAVRYDKRGIGQSKAAAHQESDLRFDHYVADAAAWVKWLSGDERFSKIIVLGHSEGSLIGMIAARQQPGVAQYISMAGAGVPAAEILRTQLKAQAQFLLDDAQPTLLKLEQGETVDTIPPMMYSLFRPSVQPYLISWFKYDPAQELAQLDMPILIVQGTTDLQVSVSDADKLAAANSRSQKSIIAGMNHVLKESEADRMKNLQTYSMPDLPLQRELMGVLVAFIRG